MRDKVTELAESAKPSRMMRRRAYQFKRVMIGAKDKIMTTAPEMGATASSQIRSAANTMGTAASQTPDAFRRMARKNPVTVGLVAFGIGWFIGSRFRARRTARRMTDPMRHMASQAVEQAKPLVRHASETVKHAGETVKQAGETVMHATTKKK